MLPQTCTTGEHWQVEPPAMHAESSSMGCALVQQSMGRVYQLPVHSAFSNHSHWYTYRLSDSPGYERRPERPIASMHSVPLDSFPPELPARGSNRPICPLHWSESPLTKYSAYNGNPAP